MGTQAKPAAKSLAQVNLNPLTSLPHQASETSQSDRMPFGTVTVLSKALISAARAVLGSSALIVLLASGLSSPLQAQATQYSCQPDSAGTGWVCEQTGPGQTNSTILRPRTPTPVTPNPESPDIESPYIENPDIESRDPETTDPVEADDDAASVDRSTATAQQVSTTTTDSANTAESQGSTVAPVREISSEFPLDWIPRESMSSEDLDVLPNYCCGGFVDPLEGQVDLTEDPASAETILSFDADSGLSQINQSLVEVDGDVVVSQGYRRITNTQSTSINRDANTVLMEGDVEFREPGLLLTGDSAFIDSDTQSNRIESAQYVLHDYGAHGNANSIIYNGDTGLVTIDNGEFSRCEPGNELWKLRAESIVLDQEANRGYARKVSLRLGDVPIFYYPFTMPFPLGDARSSGFLPPSFGSTRTGGFDLEVPYYFNLAPHYDATVAPRLLSDRGVMATAEFRYLADWSMNTVNMSHLASDDLFDPATKDILGSDSPPVEDRWFVGFEHQGRIGNRWTTFVDYNAVSDTDYFYDLGSSGLNVISQTHLNRQGRIDYHGDWLRAGVNVQRIQVIDPFVTATDINRPFDRLPQFYVDTGYDLPAGFRIGLKGQVTSFDREIDPLLLPQTLVYNGANVTGDRLNLEPELGWSLETPGWFVRSTAKYKYMEYDLQDQAAFTPQAPDIGVPVYSLDAGLIFERDRGRGGSQTLEPRLYYLYSEFQDQSFLPLFDTSELNFSFSQLFRDDRFTGGDRIGDADQLAIALTSKIYDERGQERARFSLGQIQYFQDRQVSLNNPLQAFQPRYSLLADQSSLLGEAAIKLGSRWQLSSHVQWHEEREEVDEGSFQLRYQQDSDRLFNVAYRYRQLVNSPYFQLPPTVDPSIKQTDLSAIWPLNDKWTVLGRWNYDHSNERNLESFFGLQWRDCCATIRVVAREWVDEHELFVPNSEPNQGIFVQFTLNGFGDLGGGGISNLLQAGIRGFREQEFSRPSP